MSWIGQVAHVMAKDARQMRWLIFLTLVCLAGASAEAFGVGGDMLGQGAGGFALLLTSFGGATLLLVSSAVLVAMLVHADAPAQSDAFWATRPLSPSAVVTAKLVLSGFLALVLPVLMELAALRAHDVPFGDTLRIMGSSTLVQAGMLLVVAAIAALTPDLRTLTVALIGTLITWSFASAAVRMVLPHPILVGPGVTSRLVASSILVVLGLGVVTYQYHTRNLRKTARVFALPLLAALVVSGMTTGTEPFGPRLRTPVPYGDAASTIPAPHLAMRPLRVEPGSPVGPLKWQVQVPLTLSGTRDGYRYDLEDMTLRVRLPDGSEARYAAEVSMGATLVPGRPESLSDVTSIGQPLQLRRATSHVNVPVSDEGADAIQAGAPVSVEGDVVVFKPVTLALIPARAGAAAVRPGRRFRVNGAESSPTGPVVRGTLEYVEGLDGQLWSPYPWRFYDFTLVNPERHQAIPLTTSGGGMGGSRHLVMWTASVHTYSTTLGEVRGLLREPAPSVDEAWMKGAELQITDWSPQVRFRVTVEPSPAQRGR